MCVFQLEQQAAAELLRLLLKPPAAERDNPYLCNHIYPTLVHPVLNH